MSLGLIVSDKEAFPFGRTDSEFRLGRAAFDPSKFSHVMCALQNASAVTTNASELMKKAKAFVDRNIALIPNGIDTKLFQPMDRNEALAESLGLDPARNVIRFIGELRQKKGLTTLLLAYTKVNESQPAALLIVGEVCAGEDKKQFDELYSSIPNPKISIPGYVSNRDLPSYYSVMDVLVHPSLRDGLPNVLLEAMACEKPIIATPVGGVIDVVKDCENGRIAPVSDVNSLTTIIQEILSDKSAQKHLGRSARLTVQSKYTLEQELDGNLKLYRKLGLEV